MRVVVQRVSNASVKTREKVTGSIGKGLLLLVGIHESDTMEEVEWMCRKVSRLRIFEDENDRMNISVTDINGELLVVSQFTLYGDARKGNRPSFIEAAQPDKAEELYDKMIDHLKQHTDLNVETGVFGAHMDVSLVNDGPVTLILEK